MTRVLVAASSVPARRSLEAAIRGSPGLEPAGGANPGPGLADRVLQTRAEAVLVDLGPDDPDPEDFLPELDGLASVLLVEAPGEAPLGDWLRLGVRGVLRRDAASAEIAGALAAAAAGLVALDPEAAETRSPRPRPAGGEALTDREAEVLESMAEGLSNREIAVLLGISENTVKFHLASVYGKLGVSSRAEAVSAALRTGRLML